MNRIETMDAINAQIRGEMCAILAYNDLLDTDYVKAKHYQREAEYYYKYARKIMGID